MWLGHDDVTLVRFRRCLRRRKASPDEAASASRVTAEPRLRLPSKRFEYCCVNKVTFLSSSSFCHSPRTERCAIFEVFRCCAALAQLPINTGETTAHVRKSENLQGCFFSSVSTKRRSPAPNEKQQTKQKSHKATYSSHLCRIKFTPYYYHPTLLANVSRLLVSLISLIHFCFTVYQFKP